MVNIVPIILFCFNIILEKGNLMISKFFLLNHINFQQLEQVITPHVSDLSGVID